MISRAQGLSLSLLLGAAAAAGAHAVISTAHLGDAQTKPEVVSSRAIAKRAHKLDAWQASLERALETKPPALPALNRYAAATFVSTPGAVSLPTPAAPPRRTVQEVVQQPKPAARTRPRAAAKPTPLVVKAPRRHDSEARGELVQPIEPAVKKPAPAPTVAPVAVATPTPAAPTPAPQPQPAQPPAPLSAEEQCRLLLRAAEGKSEQVKQAAESQCEALKQAAEKE